MSALHLKYRPRDLNQVFGNKAAVSSLQGLIDRAAESWNDFPRAFLMTGPSGCGKTTLARILATSIGCLPEEFREIDSAQFGGIEFIRSLRTNLAYRPMNGSPCRVVLLDECHQLSKDAQNGLLKLLEDTPYHAVIILATTDPEKLLLTIRNRCCQIAVQALDESEIHDLLLNVMKKEKIKNIPESVVEKIARDSLGCPRAALVVLDKIRSTSEEDMPAAVESLMSAESTGIDLCRALIGGKDWPTIAKIVKEMKDDPESVRRAVLGYCQSVLLGGGKLAPRAFLIMDSFKEPLFYSGKPGLSLACYSAVFK